MILLLLLLFSLSTNAQSPGSVKRTEEGIGDYVILGAVPTNPITGKVAFYYRASKFYVLTSAGVETVVGSGDVVGPAVSVDNRVASFSGITGKLIKDSGVLATELVTKPTATFTAANRIALTGGANRTLTETGFTIPIAVCPTVGDTWRSNGTNMVCNTAIHEVQWYYWGVGGDINGIFSFPAATLSNGSGLFTTGANIVQALKPILLTFSAFGHNTTTAPATGHVELRLICTQGGAERNILTEHNSWSANTDRAGISMSATIRLNLNEYCYVAIERSGAALNQHAVHVSAHAI